MVQSPGYPRVFRTYRAILPPGSSPGGTRSICDSGRRRSRHCLGPVWPGSQGIGGCAGGVPKAGRSPLELLARAALLEGKREGVEREEERRSGGKRVEGGSEGRDGGPSPALINHPRRSNVPAVHPGGGCTSPQRSRCSISLTSAVERRSRLSAPLAWNSAQLLQLLPWAAAWTRPSEIRMALSQFHFQGETKTTGWKLWTSKRAERTASRPSWTPSGRLPLVTRPFTLRVWLLLLETWLLNSIQKSSVEICFLELEDCKWDWPWGSFQQIPCKISLIRNTSFAHA
ncbi:hypothetical protein H1C71_031319 [Ictidomys tridecemlineatus]|uniref:uncharacterized protein LOC110598128 isoform X1 n=1 Tax=Ictidomys tridecemlineatus TaxID=43179 RepID=UPI000B544684|nr:uncharacterized protein LOC110598128 isoform X1 [Ictidomys tridecemlineatus]KAG3273071.1 hypothetical protein H1C71_031319 [Ictidomys tridecemlineatus]